MTMQENTNSKLVYRFDNVVSESTCIALQEYMDLTIHRKENYNVDEVPWAENEMVNYDQITDKNIIDLIRPIKYTVAELASNCFGIKLYPHFSDLVLWRTGRKMQTHQDDGGFEHGFLFPRKVSGVIYLNDNFTGGETVIKTEHATPYISKPKQGSVVIFLSDSRCEHSVNEVLSGDRYTLPLWFTDDKKFIEL